MQDVRIPYQQKRMFGFVTFVYAETVRIILAKKNPHFIQDCRVLVKPYKEKCELRERWWLRTYIAQFTSMLGLLVLAVDRFFDLSVFRKRQQQRFERVPPRLSPTCGDMEEHDDIAFGNGSSDLAFDQ